MPDTPALIDAVKEMTRVTAALQQTLAEDYPKRREIERRFVSKAQSKSRMSLVVSSVLASAIFSFLFTVTTVSTCFLSLDMEGPEICGVLPGYKTAEERNKTILKEFRQLQKITQRNEARIIRLERQ